MPDRDPIITLIGEYGMHRGVDQHFVLEWPDCPSCSSHLKKRINANFLSKYHYIILSSHVRNAMIHLGIDDLHAVTFVDEKNYTEVSLMLKSRVATYASGSEVRYVSTSKFYEESVDQQIQIDDKDTVHTIANIPVDVYRAKVKKFGTTYGALVTGNDAAGLTKTGIAWSSHDGSTKFLDKDALTEKGNTYPLGLMDFAISGDTLFLLSSLEIIYFSLGIQEIIFRRMLDFPFQCCVNDRSDDFLVTSDILVIPIHNCFIGLYSRDKYRSTPASHVVIDRRTGHTLRTVGGPPVLYTSDHTLLHNWSAASLLNGCLHIFYPFTTTTSVTDPYCNPMVLNPGLQHFDIFPLDPSTSEEIQRSEYLSSEMYHAHGNSYYGNFVLKEDGFSVEVHPGIQTRGQYVFLRQKPGNSYCNYYKTTHTAAYYWVENHELELLFYSFDENSISIFRGT